MGISDRDNYHCTKWKNSWCNSTLKSQSRHGALFTSYLLSWKILNKWEGTYWFAFLLTGPSYGLRYIFGSVTCLTVSVVSFTKHHRKIQLEGSQWGQSEHIKQWAMVVQKLSSSRVSMRHRVSMQGVKNGHSELQLTSFTTHRFAFLLCSSLPAYLSG